MATTLDITTTYAGENAGKYISPALLSAPTLEAGGLEVMQGIQKSSVIQKVDTSNLITDATCDFDPTATVTLSERVITPKELQVNLQLCKTPFKQTWDSMQLGASANKNIPSKFSDWLIARLSAKVAAQNESLIWTGSDTTNQYAGILTQLATDTALPSANEVTGTTVTASNVIDEIAKVVDALPSALYGLPDLKIYVSQNIYKLYVRALAAGGSGVGYMQQANNQSFGDVLFDGIPLFVSNGLGDNQMIAAQSSNLYFGTGEFSDWSTVQLIDMAPIDGSQNFRFVMRFSAAAQYGYAEEIVTYGVTNSVN